MSGGVRLRSQLEAQQDVAFFNNRAGRCPATCRQPSTGVNPTVVQAMRDVGLIWARRPRQLTPEMGRRTG